MITACHAEWDYLCRAISITSVEARAGTVQTPWQHGNWVAQLLVKLSYTLYEEPSNVVLMEPGICLELDDDRIWEVW